MFEFRHWGNPADERSADPAADCIRCGEFPQVDGLGYCGHCHWAVRAEIEAGFHTLRQYLGSWALFGEWCAQRGERIA
jgi:hypothetical protein